VRPRIEILCHRVDRELELAGDLKLSSGHYFFATFDFPTSFTFFSAAGSLHA
jgi:hypothetical protein